MLTRLVIKFTIRRRLHGIEKAVEDCPVLLVHIHTFSRLKTERFLVLNTHETYLLKNEAK